MQSFKCQFIKKEQTKNKNDQYILHFRILHSMICCNASPSFIRETRKIQMGWGLSQTIQHASKSLSHMATNTHVPFRLLLFRCSQRQVWSAFPLLEPRLRSAIWQRAWSESAGSGWAESGRPETCERSVWAILSRECTMACRKQLIHCCLLKESLACKL